MDERGYDKMQNTNVKSVYFFIKDCFELIAKSKKASIILMSSFSAYEHSNLLGVYSMTKLALVSMVKLLAKEVY